MEYGYLDKEVKALVAERDRLAAENAELRGKLDDVRMGIGCARGQRTTQFCAEAAQRDDVITRLLALVKPEMIYRRACEIAGRTE